MRELTPPRSQWWADARALAGACPRCGQRTGLPLVRGFPSYELIELVEAGAVALGGCVVSGEDPEFRCATCGHEWAGSAGAPGLAEEPGGGAQGPANGTSESGSHGPPR